MASDARAVVLGRVRAAIGGEAADAAAVRWEWAGIARSYVRQAGLGREEILERLVGRLHDYDAQVLRVELDGVRDGAAQMLAARGVRRMVVPAGLRAEWMPDGIEFVVDEGLAATALDAVDGVMTASTLAIAETGTIVLQGVAGQGRRAVSLVPDYHLCVVDVTSVVETVPEAMARLQGTAGLTTTFISGPSATADIEMTRIKGVHGPRFLDVLLVGAE
jgi:L-lactate dehydrogenase complex protein LldG